MKDIKREIEASEEESVRVLRDMALFGMSSDYTTAIIVNLVNDEYDIVFNHETNNAKAHREIEHFSEYVKNYTENFVLPEYVESMKYELSIEGMKEHFETENDYHYVFETIPNKAGQSNFQAHVVKQCTSAGCYAFLGFRSIDEILKKRRFYQDALRDANNALMEQQDRIMFALPGGVKISYDDEVYSFKFVSEQLAHMLGYKNASELREASNNSIIGLVHPDDVTHGVKDALRQYEMADHYETMYRVRCKDGSYKYVEDRGQKMHLEDGKVEHWNLILDKNDLFEKNVALESERKANKSKSDFLSRMSHDMRTPLNGIIGLLAINNEHFENKELVRKNHDKMQVAANHLLSLINDILQMSKIEDGSITLSHEVVDFGEISKSVIHIVKDNAIRNAIHWGFNKVNEGDYPLVYGSPVHLRQVFLNIYSNCIKYNRINGSIETNTSFFYPDDDHVIMHWEIVDTGIGMSEAFLKKLFDPFAQEKDDARSEYQGTGLGMAIVKGLIEEMGGTIDVSSKEGEGSRFVIEIPFETAPEQEVMENAEEEAETVDIAGVNLLLAEDNELNAEIAGILLDDNGATFTLVDNGKKALNLFEEMPPGTFDGILMDVMMPVMDGLTATRAIRAMNRPDAKTIPIIAMTANAFVEDKKNCLDAGMNAHLAKPFDKKLVLKTIHEFCRKNK